MRPLPTLLATVALALVFSACESSSKSTAEVDADDEPTLPAMTHWVRSVNGTHVLDADDDLVQFRIVSGALHRGAQVFATMWINLGADLFYKDPIAGVVKIGRVAYIVNAGGETVAALVSDNEKRIDLYGFESTLEWSESEIAVKFAASLRPDTSDGR